MPQVFCLPRFRATTTQSSNPALPQLRTRDNGQAVGLLENVQRGPLRRRVRVLFPSLTLTFSPRAAFRGIPSPSMFLPASRNTQVIRVETVGHNGALLPTSFGSDAIFSAASCTTFPEDLSPLTQFVRMMTGGGKPPGVCTAQAGSISNAGRSAKGSHGSI